MGLICNVIGARPNFMKMAPVILEQRRRGMNHIVVHTGQHYDTHMSGIFLAALGIPEPDIALGIGSGSHAEQTARIMVSFERVCLERKPDIVIVAGDVNSTLACSLAAAKLCISIAHVESGLRSFDYSMPEEINRIVTDRIASILFTTEESGNKNLHNEGIASEKVYFVGNSMVDSLNIHLNEALEKQPWIRFGLEPKRYGIVTLHRPSNVDDPRCLSHILAALQEIACDIPLVFSAHPRTRQRIEQFGINLSPIMLVEPLGYIDFLGLMANAALILTDSGGIQEESTVLRVPCVTLRENTERPITIRVGTNVLAGVNGGDIVAAADRARRRKSETSLPELWDGHAASRIVDVIEQALTTGVGRAAEMA